MKGNLVELHKIHQYTMVSLKSERLCWLLQILGFCAAAFSTRWIKFSISEQLAVSKVSLKQAIGLTSPSFDSVIHSGTDLTSDKQEVCVAASVAVSQTQQLPVGGLALCQKKPHIQAVMSLILTLVPARLASCNGSPTSSVALLLFYQLQDCTVVVHPNEG